MTVEIFAPNGAERYTEVELLDIDATGGRFGLLERHIDCTAALETGLLAISARDGEEHYIGIDGGVMVKIGGSVRIATGRIVSGVGLEKLEQKLAEQRNESTDAQRQRMRTLTRLELQLARGTVEAGGTDSRG